MKFFILYLLFLSTLCAQYQKVKVGTIDKYFQKKITETKMRFIIEDIERVFDSEVGFNVFDYSSYGKPINFIYNPPKIYEELDEMKREYSKKSDDLKNKITILKKYKEEVRKKNRYPVDEFKRINDYVKSEESEIKNKTEELRDLSKLLEQKSKNPNYDYRILGKSFGNRIEIYSFTDEKQLKALLAHEIAHLVGIPHIEAKKALMNPTVQQNQVERLHLTKDDIDNFKNNF